MALQVDIYGTLVYVPDTPIYVEKWDTDNPKEQYWRRKELPDYFDLVEKDKDGNALLNARQRAFASEEVRRCVEGFYFLNNGELTYITGKNYFYLQWWKLEDAIYPDYRDADRRYFLFLNYWEHILWCLGIFRGKKRREGASSQATSNLIYECIFYTNSNCGLVSKSQLDSRDTFTDMAAFGYQQLPIFLKPRQLNREGSVTELVFAAKIEKNGSGDIGQRSKINYRSPALNAYDRGRLSRGLFDEGGKWDVTVPFSRFITIVTKTMVKGAKRVGFAECPSTVNEMTKGGGAEYKICWDQANQFKTGGKKTKNRFVTYFTPAYDNYEGFIDRYGMSVIDEPTEDQYEYLVGRWVVKDPVTGDTISEVSEDDIRKGAKVYVASRRVGLEGDLLEEEIRMNPCTVKEMFEAANVGCAFNSYKINQQKAYLEEHPPVMRQVVFYRKEDQTVGWREDKNGLWKILAFPPPGEENKFKYEIKFRKPDRIGDGIISIDGYTNSQGGRYGSKAGAYIIRKFDVKDPENTGMAIAQFYGRPSEKPLLHDQIMMAGEFYGYECCFELVADDYYTHFRDRGRLKYLMKVPLSSIDPEKRKKENIERPYGYLTNPFALTKALDAGISYVENYCNKIYFIELLNQMLDFDPGDRTKSDLVVSFINGLVCAAETTVKPQKQKESLVKEYANNFSQN